MKSAKLGKRTSDVEITNVSKHGFWLLIKDKERFIPFDQFPWFRDAPIGHLLNVELPSPHHLHWPDLDVDIAVESIDHPERFPLVSKVRSNPPYPNGDTFVVPLTAAYAGQLRLDRGYKK